ncbi:hypothetical protein CHRY9390_00902 [Chryseobacterium aquaeductus]|uniref:DUF3810 domain-containing protein n=1 Tax=Chryseobacterium aquaeductus TaxID=2675056 RepID=A0A9N8MEB7_9FLAO|nr:DUF3810 domain-containing protein [Chryseobacterium aquaeductus]CAA7330241.1 hypothetical protein CHRY9390_00902 [Chryseobacterium potabilaquae]CAD7802260.1 hypothetical protein CHRY9390_00902 [Chryseobacterium aquaeductus]
MITAFESFFEIQKKIHQLLFSWIPFSVGDLLYLLLGTYLFYLITKCFKKRSRQQSILKALILINILYFTYQIFWGMLYFQTPIIARLPEKEITLKERKKLALRYLEKCKQTRMFVTEDQHGIFIIADIKSIESEILHQQTKLPTIISDKKVSSINSFKSSLFKNVMSFTGILGYYNPFTAEAQYNCELPSSYLPFTVAHESAHQLGFAREQEANFIGYLVGVDSPNIELRYSTEYFTLKTLLNSMVYEDEQFVEYILKNYSDGMKRDRAFEKKFVLKHQGLLNDFFGITNNLFLKSNQQEGSVTYSYFIDLLVRYEK